MKFKVTLNEQLLGTACANPKVHAEWVAVNSKDEAKILEELAALPAEERYELAMTVFPRENGRVFIWDYQFKGFIKEAVRILAELHDPIPIAKSKLTRYTADRIIDNYVFVFPRKIFLCDESKLGPVCTRPLRAKTAQGERICLASSETVPAGVSFDVLVNPLTAGLIPVVLKAMDYGALKGLGQWRNAGNGRFGYETLDDHMDSGKKL